MKTNLPPSPISLERNSLRLEVARLNSIVEQKDKEISLFKNEITNVTNITKCKEASLTNEIKQKDNTISALRSKEQELLNKVSVLEGSNILLIQSLHNYETQH